MGKINMGRVILGGLVAGLVLNIVDSIAYGVVLAADFEAAMRDLGRGPIAASQILWFVIVDFLYGILLVYLYAAIRPRFGPGPRTAVIAGVLVWVGAALLHTLAEMPMGLIPTRLAVIGLVIAMVAFPVAAVVGAWLYKEGEARAPVL
jgi:hypothetical protein